MENKTCSKPPTSNYINPMLLVVFFAVATIDRPNDRPSPSDRPSLGSKLVAQLVVFRFQLLLPRGRCAGAGRSRKETKKTTGQTYGYIKNQIYMGTYMGTNILKQAFLYMEDMNGTYTA